MGWTSHVAHYEVPESHNSGVGGGHDKDRNETPREDDPLRMKCGDQVVAWWAYDRCRNDAYPDSRPSESPGYPPGDRIDR